MKVPTYVRIRSGDVDWHIDADFAHLVQGGFLGNVDEAPAHSTVIKAVKVKQHMEVTQTDTGEQYIVKMYKEDGPVRRLKAIWRGPRAAQELDACKRVAERGIPCAPILAAGLRSGRSFVVVRRMKGWDRLDRVYQGLDDGGSVRRRIAFAYGQFCRRIHDAGVYQYDLNPTNVLARIDDGEPRFLMIDFERIEFMDSVPLAVRLEAIGRMDRLRGVPRADRLRFLAGYSAGEDEWRSWKEWSRRIATFREESLRGQLAKVAKACTHESRNFGEFEHEKLRGFYRKPDPETGEGGIDVTTLRELAIESGRARLGIRLKHAENAKKKWAEDCVRFHAGQTRHTPLAVLWIKGSKRGFIIYG